MRFRTKGVGRAIEPAQRLESNARPDDLGAVKEVESNRVFAEVAVVGHACSDVVIAIRAIHLERRKELKFGANVRFLHNSMLTIRRQIRQTGD